MYVCSEVLSETRGRTTAAVPNQGRAETFGRAGAQSIKGAHGTRI